MKTTYRYSTLAAVALLAAGAAFGAAQDPNPPGLTNPVPDTAYVEVIGNYAPAQFNGHSPTERVLFDFDHPDYFANPAGGSQLLDGVFLFAEGPARFRFDFSYTGGNFGRLVGAHGAGFFNSPSNSLAYAGSAVNTNVVTFSLRDFNFGAVDPLYGVGFVINRFIEDTNVLAQAVVRVYSDLGTNQLGPDYAVQDNNSGSQSSFFGVAGDTEIRQVEFICGASSSYTIDDLVVLTVPVTNAPPMVMIDAVAVETNAATVSFQSASGTVYQLEAAMDLVSSNWAAAGSSQIGNGAVLQLSDPVGAADRKALRVVVP